MEVEVTVPGFVVAISGRVLAFWNLSQWKVLV